MVTFWLYSVSKYSKRCSPEAYTASFMLLSSSVNARLQLCTWVEKAWLRNPCGGVWGQLLLIYQQWHYQQCLVKREPVIQNSGATLAVKAGFKLHFPWLPWRLWEVIMKRGFQSSVVTPVGITIVVCAVITRELLAHDQIIIIIILYSMKCSVMWWQRCSTTI